MSSSNNKRDDRRHRSRSKSHRYRDDDRDDDYRKRSYGRSSSRSRSLERHKRRHNRHSRSRSRDNDNRRYRSSRRYSRSPSRSRSRSRSRALSQRSHKRRSGSGSQSCSSRRSRSRSSHRSQKHSRHHRSDSHSPREAISTKYDNQSNSRSSSTDKNNEKRDLSADIDSRRSKTEEPSTRDYVDQENSSTQYFSSNTNPDHLENLPLPEQTENSSNANYEFFDDPDEPFDKERIHREMEEKLRAALAKEGKVYPPKKPEASHPVFANDGSFLEIFKKMQEAQNTAVSSSVPVMAAVTLPAAASTSVAATAATSYVPRPAAPAPPMVGRRRGGKILKTGLVAKPKVTSSVNEDKDFWSLYLAEVNKYKNHACESDTGNRPLLK